MNAGINKYGYGDEAEKSPLPVSKPKAEPMKGVVSSVLLSVIRHFGHSRDNRAPSLPRCCRDTREENETHAGCQNGNIS